MIDWISHELATNEIAQAAVIAAPASMLLYTARELPGRALAFLKRQFSVELGFNSDSPDYDNIQEFVASRIVSQRWSRKFQYSLMAVHLSQSQEDEAEEYDQADNPIVRRFKGLAVGYGTHIGFWRGRLVIIERTMIEAQATDKFKERMTLTFVTTRRDLVSEFAVAAYEFGQRKNDPEQVSVHANMDRYWGLIGRLPKRRSQTIFGNGEAEALIRHVRNFEADQARYRERGLPYHTGILLSGKPGTGKTSLIHVAASELNRSIHYLNLGSVEGDEKLSQLLSLNHNWTKTLLVIEDADAAGVKVSRKGDEGGNGITGVSLSALLNSLDGLLTPDGLVVIATSNHPEKFDPAILRDGRFDIKIDVGDLEWPSFVAMANLFGFGITESDPRRVNFTPAPGATLRSKLIEGGVDAVIGESMEEAA